MGKILSLVCGYSLTHISVGEGCLLHVLFISLVICVDVHILSALDTGLPTGSLCFDAPFPSFEGFLTLWNKMFLAYLVPVLERAISPWSGEWFLDAVLICFLLL